MLDISDGDYLLESLRDFKPPNSDRKNKNKKSNISIFEPGRLPDGKAL